jgi:hypothetical protein
MPTTTLSVLRLTLCLSVLMSLVSTPPAAAQGLGGLLKKKLKAKMEKVIRCAIDDTTCVSRAEAEGKPVALADEGAAAKGLGALLKKKLNTKLEETTVQATDQATAMVAEVVRCAVDDAACISRAEAEGEPVLAEEGAEGPSAAPAQAPPGPEETGNTTAPAAGPGVGPPAASDSPADPAPAPTLMQLILRPKSVSLTPGSTQEFSVFGRMSNGDSVPVRATYSAIGGSISGTGLYTASKIGGSYRIIATSGKLADTSTISVLAPLPAPIGNITIGIPAGPMNVTDQTTWCGGAWTGTYSSIQPLYILSRLQAAARCGFTFFLVQPRAKVKNPDGTYSVTKAQQQIDSLARYLPTDTLKKYAPYVGGFVLSDDMDCTSCWGGAAITKSQLASVAQYARTKMPLLPIGIRGLPQWAEGTVLSTLLDFGWAQYHTGKGDIKTYYEDALRSAARQGMAVALGINTSDCAGPSTGSCTATQLQTFGNVALGYAASCAFINWEWDSTWFSRSDIKAVWAGLLTRAKSHAAVSCRRQ